MPEKISCEAQRQVLFDTLNRRKNQLPAPEGMKVETYMPTSVMVPGDTNRGVGDQRMSINPRYVAGTLRTGEPIGQSLPHVDSPPIHRDPNSILVQISDDQYVGIRDIARSGKQDEHIARLADHDIRSVSSLLYVPVPADRSFASLAYFDVNFSLDKRMVWMINNRRPQPRLVIDRGGRLSHIDEEGRSTFLEFADVNTLTEEELAGRAPDFGVIDIISFPIGNQDSTVSHLLSLMDQLHGQGTIQKKLTLYNRYLGGDTGAGSSECRSMGGGGGFNPVRVEARNSGVVDSQLQTTQTHADPTREPLHVRYYVVGVEVGMSDIHPPLLPDNIFERLEM
jgi:hypothetical protein